MLCNYRRTRPRRFAAFIIIILALLSTGQARPERIVVGAFSQSDRSGWEPKKLAGETAYQLVREDARQALRATSKGSASGLVKRLQIDLTRTPVLVWSWRVDHVFAGIDEQSKSGDDYPARLYVVASGGLLFWKTRALNYVWSSSQPISSAWPNPFTERVMMIPVTAGAQSLGRWVSNRRNVRADFRRYFGEDVTAIDALAVMTDTDNTSEHAVAYYGDIVFEQAAPR